MTAYQQKQLRKSIYIPLCCAGKITNLQAAQRIGIAPRNVLKLKNRYKQIGDLAFKRVTHPRKSIKYNEQFVKHLIYLYHKYYEGAPFAAFWRGLRDIENIQIPLPTLRYLFKKYKVKSGNEYTPRKKVKHESRVERPSAGELLQMDASKHDWFLNGTYTNLHGAIDDATHTVTGLYFCDNECRLGYNEVLKQTFQNYGIMEAVYIDRHSSFVSTPRHKTLEERLQYEKASNTHFNDLCKKLNIEVILALSAEGKGRIERLWGTLQDNLPYIFRRLGIQDNQSANEFLKSWLPRFNSEFAIPSRNQFTRWKKIPRSVNLDFMLSIKVPRRTDSYGVFLFHDHYFELHSPRRCHVKFTLCLSESFGLKGFYEGKFYPVSLCDVLSGSSSSYSMPMVEQDLIARYLLNDLHEQVV